MEYKKKGNCTTVAGYVSDLLKVEDYKKVLEFWEEKHETNQYSLVGMQRALSLAKLHKKGKVVIVGDYDCDGIMSTEILTRGLRKAGYEVSYRIPHPMSEGYGLNMKIIEEIPDKDGNLLITVDNGIAAAEEIKAAKKAGMAVLILDHHMAPIDSDGNPIIPEADVVIDPNAISKSADFSGYCGAGLAFRFIRKLFEIEYLQDEDFLNSLLTLAAIATVADSVPLLEENHVFVKRGLKLLSTGKSFIGMQALLSAMNLTGKELTETDIAFSIAPCINAGNRLYDLEDTALKLLLTDDPKEAVELAKKAVMLNEERKLRSKEAEDLSEKVISGYKMERDFPLIINLGSQAGERIVGITAGKLAEKYNVPAIVFAETEAGIFKGSGRSAGGIDLFTALQPVKSMLLTFGGHKAACGLSCEKKDFRAVKKTVQEYFGTHEIRPEKKSVMEYDLEIKDTQLHETLSELRQAGPFGEGFPAPVFKVVFTNEPKFGSYVKTMAREGVKLSGKYGEAIAFGVASEFEGHKPKEVNLYGSLSVNVFRGKETDQVSFDGYEIVTEYT